MAVILEKNIKTATGDAVIALAGNPNVGKSTVFNALTGLKQHTGNWPGKTVGSAFGTHKVAGKEYTVVDLPGTYSLLAHSPEEEIARDFICFGGADVVVVVCDAGAMAHGMNLVLQTLELTQNVVVCVNLLDEAARKGIKVDTQKLSQILNVPVVGTAARSGKGLKELVAQARSVIENKGPQKEFYKIQYTKTLEDCIALLEDELRQHLPNNINARWAAVRLIENPAEAFKMLDENLGVDLSQNTEIANILLQVKTRFEEEEITEEKVKDIIVRCLVFAAEQTAAQVADMCENCANAQSTVKKRHRKIDKLLTGKLTGIPIMFFMFMGIFWFTIVGANYPSQLLSDLLLGAEPKIYNFLASLGVAPFVLDPLMFGVYRVTAWVISVMLPPMAIFFPLFTFLEDVGFLPRIAFNLDGFFQRAKTCGKQALTMCMGFGCNAAGVVGARIIDSPRERLIAIITNSFVPCNGRFPTLIAIISMFFVAGVSGGSSLAGAFFLTVIIVLSVVLTFLVSHLLSVTVLKGVPSEFTLELPPYRKPQLGKIVVRSVLDRTLHVLARAVAVAAPAGLVIFLLANTMVGGVSLYAHCIGFFDPFARLLGMDGVILMAFIMGFPANEIVIPLIIMGYMGSGTLSDLSGLEPFKALLVQNGWTTATAVCTMLFALVHWPCSTTCLSIQKESGHFKWTALSIALPTVIGMLICFVVNFVLSI